MKAYMLFLMLIGAIVVHCNMGEPHPLTNLIISNLSPPKPGAQFGQKIGVSFSALEKEWKLNLEVHDDIISSDASIISRGNNDDIIHQTSMHSHVYTSDPGIFPSMRTTIFDDDLMRAELITKDGIFRIVPRPQFPDQSKVSSMSKSKMVLYLVHANVEEMKHQRSLSQVFRSFVNDGIVPCYTGQDKRKTLSLGVAVDIGFREKIDSIYGVDPAKKDQYLLQTVQDYVSQVNEVFKAQFNIEFKLGALETSENTQAQKWNQKPSISKPNTNPAGGSSLVCPDVELPNDGLSTANQLKYFNEFTIPRASTANYWSLLTDCQPFAVGGQHQIAIAYSGSVCPIPGSGGAASLASYVPPEIGESWTAYAGALGYAFGTQISTNAGIMNNQIGSAQYNGYYPSIVDPKTPDPAYNGRIQYAIEEKTPMCALIQSYITSEGGKVNCFEQAPQSYLWKTINCTLNPPVACSCFCNGVGLGFQVSTYFCSDENGRKVPDEMCIFPKPVGNMEPCDFPSKNQGQQCPGTVPPNSLCVSAEDQPKLPNGILEEGEECDFGNVGKCCSNCRKVLFGECIRIDSSRDAAFTDSSTDAHYIFQDRNFIMFTDLTSQTGIVKSIKGNWKNLDPWFHNGIDAIVQNQDIDNPKNGLVYIFKDSKVTEYDLEKGESPDWPKNIKDSIFSSINFTLGLPNARRPIDAAMSSNKVVWFFQGIEAVKYTWGQVTQDSQYPVSLADEFKLPLEHFNKGVSAVNYYPKLVAADFYSTEGRKIRWKPGQGTTGTVLTNSPLGEDDSANANAKTCPVSCTTCITSATCEICDLGYFAVSGSCFEREFMLELKFDVNEPFINTYDDDKRLIKETNFEKPEWGTIPGVTGQGNAFPLEPAKYIKLKDKRTPLKDFFFIAWIKFTEVQDSNTILTGTAMFGSTPLTFSVLGEKKDAETLSISFTFGSTIVRSPVDVKIDRYVYLIIGYTGSADPKKVSVSVDSNEATLDHQVLNQNGEIIDIGDKLYLKDLVIGGEFSSFVGVLDSFQIENANIPATRKFMSSSRLSCFVSSWLVIFSLVIYYFF